MTNEEGKVSACLACESDLVEIAALFDAVIHLFEVGENLQGWARGIYPTKAIAEKAVRGNCLYKLVCDGRIAGTVILNHQQSPAYGTVPWRVKAEGEQVLVVHTLALHPDFRGRGFAQTLLAFAQQLAEERKCLCLRLDTFYKNQPAMHLYEKCGYQFISNVDLMDRFKGQDCYRCFEKSLFV